MSQIYYRISSWQTHTQKSQQPFDGLAMKFGMVMFHCG